MTSLQFYFYQVQNVQRFMTGPVVFCPPCPQNRCTPLLLTRFRYWSSRFQVLYKSNTYYHYILLVYCVQCTLYFILFYRRDIRRSLLPNSFRIRTCCESRWRFKNTNKIRNGTCRLYHSRKCLARLGSTPDARSLGARRRQAVRAQYLHIRRFRSTGIDCLRVVVRLFAQERKQEPFYWYANARECKITNAMDVFIKRVFVSYFKRTRRTSTRRHISRRMRVPAETSPEISLRCTILFFILFIRLCIQCTQ